MFDPIRIIYGAAFVLSVYGVIRVLWLEARNWRKRRKLKVESKANRPE